MMKNLDLAKHEAVLAALLAVTLAVLSFQSAAFFTSANLLNQGRFTTEIGLIALGMTFVIVSGGIDLSVGSIFGMAAVLVGVLWKDAGLPLPAAMFLSVLVGTLAGVFNGLIITIFRVPALIVTLATLALYRGIAEGISKAQSVGGFPDWFLALGQGEWVSVPTQLWIFGALATQNKWPISRRA